MELNSQTFSCNGQSIHTMIGGKADAPVILMLHGFPENWEAWAGVAANLAKQYRIILPDQRGFNLSSKPDGVSAYDAKHLVADMADLISQVSPDQPIILCGHDWGASVAYALAMRHSDKISHLIIANGVHPICFQKALYAGGEQTHASQYMNVLSEPDNEERLSRNAFAPLFKMFESFSSAPWLNDEKRENYRIAWSHDKALTSMLNWYRASPMVVPKTGTPAIALEITSAMREKYAITMPHFLLWGKDDVALLPEARADLSQFCTDLTVHEIADASHWVLHEKPKQIAELIQAFVEK